MLAAVCGGCVLGPMRPAEGPAEIQVTPRISLKLPRTLAFLPAADGLKLMHALGERPGAEVLGVVVTRAEGTPRMMIIFAKARDAQGVSDVELVGWDEVPAIRSLIQEILLAQERM